MEVEGIEEEEMEVEKSQVRNPVGSGGVSTDLEMTASG